MKRGRYEPPRSRLRPGPSPKAAESSMRSEKYYGYLAGGVEGYIIPVDGPSSPSHPVGVRTGAERRGFAIHLQSICNRASIRLQSRRLTWPRVSGVSKPQTHAPRGPNYFPKRKAFGGSLFTHRLTITCDVTATDKKGGAWWTRPTSSTP